MFNKRDLVVFLAGAEFFHTLSHALIPYFMQMPVELNFMSLTHEFNMWAVVINAVITLALIMWARKLPR